MCADDVRGRRARHARTTCADDVRVTPGVVLHEIGQLRQVFAWVSAINLTSNNRSLVNQTRGSHLGQLCIKTNVLLVSFAKEFGHPDWQGYGSFSVSTSLDSDLESLSSQE